MIKDIILNEISSYLDNLDIFNYSLTCKYIYRNSKDIRLKLYRYKCANSLKEVFCFNNKNNPLSKRYGTNWYFVIEYLRTDWILIDVLYRISLVLIKNNDIKIDKYYNKKYPYKSGSIFSKKHYSSSSIYSDVIYSRNVYISSVYRMESHKFYKIKKNLRIKALIY